MFSLHCDSLSKAREIMKSRSLSCVLHFPSHLQLLNSSNNLLNYFFSFFFYILKYYSILLSSLLFWYRPIVRSSIFSSSHRQGPTRKKRKRTSSSMMMVKTSTPSFLSLSHHLIERMTRYALLHGVLLLLILLRRMTAFIHKNCPDRLHSSAYSLLPISKSSVPYRSPGLSLNSCNMVFPMRLLQSALVFFSLTISLSSCFSSLPRVLISTLPTYCNQHRAHRSPRMKSSPLKRLSCSL